jgi:hypothetical protein
VDNYTLADTFWPAFKMTVQEGKAKGVMCSCVSMHACTVSFKRTF